MAAGELRQVVPGVYRYADGLVNWYLLEEDSQLTLVDAGWPRSWKNVEAAVSSLGRSTRDISAVVLTHAHPDHLGAAEKVRTSTGATVHVNRAEVPRAYGKTRSSNPLLLVPGLVPSLYRRAR
jgi:glyoxylase-like metal-dependent hydrolase (beta-lactamase superfamily II)